ncbi:hypothetical protein D9M68_953210 [compost metagenome]
MGVAALGLDVRTQRHEAIGAPAGQHHGRARTGQRLGKLFAQTARRTGDEGHSARQIQAVCH